MSKDLNCKEKNGDSTKMGGIKISKVLKNLRTKKGITQKEVSQKLGITPQAYSSYERDKNTPDLETLHRLADIFSIPLSKMIEYTEGNKNKRDTLDNAYLDYLYLFDAEMNPSPTGIEILKDLNLFLNLKSIISEHDINRDELLMSNSLTSAILFLNILKENNILGTKEININIFHSLIKIYHILNSNNLISDGNIGNEILIALELYVSNNREILSKGK